MDSQMPDARSGAACRWLSPHSGAWPALLAALLVPVLAPAGEVDPTFGTTGRLTFPAGFGGLAALPDGRLQLASLGDGRVRVLRLDENARPDPVSGNPPLIETSITPLTAEVQRTFVANDGRSYLAVDVDQGLATIQSAGAVEIVPKDEGRLMRLLPDGRPDPGFGPDGMRAFPASRVNQANSSAIIDAVVTANGTSYVLVDYYYERYDADFGLRLFRLRPDGELDATFANGGEFSVPGEYKYWQPWSLALLQGDRVLLQGSAGQAMVIGPTGRAEFLPEVWRSALQGAESVAVASTGQYVYLATVSESVGLGLDVSRWHPDLTLDTTFGNAGTGHSRTSVDRGISLSEFSQIRLLAPGAGDSHLFVATVVRTPVSSGTLIHRMRADGTADPTSGGESLSGDNAWLSPLAQQDGGLVVSTGQRTALRLVWSAVDSAGHVAMPLACNADNYRSRSTDPLKVSLTRSLGSKGRIEVRYRTQLLRADPNAAQKLVEGVLVWGDGVNGVQSFEVPGVYEAFDVLLEAVSGQPVIDCTSARIQVLGGSASPAQTTTPPQPGGGATPEGGGGTLNPWALVLLSLLLAGRARLRTR